MDFCPGNDLRQAANADTLYSIREFSCTNNVKDPFFACTVNDGSPALLEVEIFLAPTSLNRTTSKKNGGPLASGPPRTSRTLSDSIGGEGFDRRTTEPDYENGLLD
jgi:hypothetical protein